MSARRTKKKREFAKIPGQHKTVLKHAMARDGARNVAAKLGMSVSVLYRALQDAEAGVRASTLAKIGHLVEVESKGASAGDTLDFKGAVLKVARILNGLEADLRKDVLDFVLEVYTKAEGG